MMFEFVGTMRTPAPSQSVIDSMQLNPVSRGKGPIKSIVMLSLHPSRTGRRCSGPMGFFVLDLFHKQSMHTGIYACSKLCCIFSQ